MIDNLLVNELLPVLSVVLLFLVFSSYLVIRLPWSYVFKLVIIPLMIFGSFFMVVWFERMLGYAVHEWPTERFLVLGHRTVTKDEKKMIELWIFTKDGKTRLHAIPWSQQTEEQLRKGEAEQKRYGTPLVGEPKGKRKQGFRDDVPEDYLQFHNLKPEATSPKREYQELDQSPDISSPSQ